MTHPGQDRQEPPTTPEPWAAGSQPPVFSPGSASVPQGPPAPTPAPPGPASYPPPDYGPWAAAPSQAKGRTGLIVGLVVTVLLLLGVAATAAVFLLPTGKNSNAQQATTQTSGPGTTSAAPTTTTAAARTSAAAARFTGDLRTLLVPLPRGTRPLPQFADNDGKLDDLDQTLEFFDEAREQWSRLLGPNYQRGAAAHWFTDDSVVRIFLFQFRSRQDAVGFGSSLRGAGIQGHSVKGEVTGIPGSAVFVADGQGRTTYTVTVRGDIAIYIGMLHPGKIDLADTTALAATQHDRVPDL